MVAPSAFWEDSLLTAPTAETVCLMMVKKCLQSKLPILLLFTHHPDNRNSVAIARMGEVAALLGGRKRK
jgi:hypothetical protein